MKFHDDRCKGKAVMHRKPNRDGQTDGRTDGRTDGHGDSSIPPLTSLRGVLLILNTNIVGQLN